MKAKVQLLLIGSWVIWAMLFFALVLILVNPRWKYETTATHNQSEVHLYLDESASMYDKLNTEEGFSALTDFVAGVERLWSEEVKLWYFADELRSANMEGYEDDRVSAFREDLRFVRMPTRFNLVEERLFFADSKHIHFIISDFRFRDGFRDLNGLKGTTNIFYISPSSDVANKISLNSKNTDFPKTVSAGFFLNPESSVLSSTAGASDYPSSSLSSLTLDVLFYSDQANATLNYELNVLTQSVLEDNVEGMALGKALNEINLNRQILKRGKVRLTGHYQKNTWKVNIPADVLDNWQKGWMQLELRVKPENIKQAKDGNVQTINYADRVNLLPQGNALRISLVSFGVNKNTFLIKNSLDRYDAYEVKSIYLGALTSQRNQQGELSPQKRSELQVRLNSLMTESDLFILIAPPIEALKFFTDNAKKPTTQKAYLHIPGDTGVSTQLQVSELDFSTPPINFLDDNAISRDHWQKSLPQMNGVALPLAPGDIAFHTVKTSTNESSAFFIRGYEVYLGIENLFFLNQNLLADEKTSFADLFWVKLINYVNDKLIKSKEESAHNYFLGEAIVENGLRQNLVHLYENQEGIFVSPSLSHSGAYLAPRGTPPYVYRIPLEEYFPPPVDMENVSDDKFFSFEEALAFLETIENYPPPLITRETTLRESPYYPYLIVALLVGFLLLLSNKWLIARMARVV